MSEDTSTPDDTRRAQRARLRDAQLAFLEALRKKTGLSRRALALSAGASSATLNRVVLEEDRLLSADTLHRLGERHGLVFQPPDPVESEASGPIDMPPPIRTALEALTSTTQLHGHRGASLEGRAILDGDVAVVDTARPPQTGDVVLANLSTKPGRPAENTLRVYIAPHLVGCPLDPRAVDDLRPVAVDDVTAKILGVVTGIVRWTPPAQR